MESKPQTKTPSKLKIKVNINDLIENYKIVQNELMDNDEISKFTNSFFEYLKENSLSFKFEESVLTADSNQQVEIPNKNYTIIETNEKLENLQFIGYPKGNLLLLLINNILLCIINKSFPFSFYPLAGFSEKTYESVDKLNKLFNDNNQTKINLNFIDKLSERGILTLLGLRETAGSINTYLPPSITILSSNFLEQHTKEPSPNNPKAKIPILTVGARALCKHSHRASEGFWPDAKGGDSIKNQKAETMLKMFFEKCIWINIHGLPHEIAIIELRIDKGYGIRWQIDGMFRGFLEPQMENGHEKGWKH